MYVLVGFEKVVNIVKGLVKGLYINIIMNSTAQMVDNNFNKSGPDKNENKVKGFFTIYDMESKKQRTAKRPDTNLMDSDVPDIKVPIMELSKRKRFNTKWVEDAKTKLAYKIEEKNMAIAGWILNKKIKKTKKLPLPAKIENLIKLVMGSKYFKKMFQNNKLSVKKIP